MFVNVMYFAVMGLVTLGNAVAALVRRRDRILAGAMLVVLAVVFGGNDWNPDYSAYKAAFEATDRGWTSEIVLTFEPGFTLLMRAATWFGLDYQGLVGVIAILCLFLVHGTVRRFGGAANFVYPLYFLYPFAFDVIQLRNTLALAVVIRGLPFLLRGGMRGRMLFTVFVVGAMTMHVSAGVYLILLFIPLGRRVRAWPVILGVMGTAALLAAPGLVAMLREFTEWFTQTDKFDTYFDTRARMGFLLLALAQFWGFYLLDQARAAVADKAEASAEERQFALFARNASLLLMGAIPLYTISSNMWRFSRNLHILYYLGFFLGYNAMASNKRRQRRYLLSVIAYSTFLFAVQLATWGESSLIVEVLSNNVLLRALRGEPIG